MIAALRELGLSPSYVRLCESVDGVLYAAQALRSAQFPPQFRIVGELHRLNAAVATWEAALAECQLDSDTNGFDRSQRWEGGDSFEQSSQQPLERRCRVPATPRGKEGGQADSTEAERSGSVRSLGT